MRWLAIVLIVIALPTAFAGPTEWPTYRLDVGRSGTWGPAVEAGAAWEVAVGDTLGASAAPILVDGVLFTTTSFGKLLAIDPVSGSILWEHPYGEGGAPSPIAINDEVAVLASGRIHVIEARNGTLRWDHDFGSDAGIAPVGRSGTYCAALNHGGLSCADRSGEIWQATTGDSIGVQLALSGDRVIAVSLDGKAHAFDFATGTQHWVSDVAPNAFGGVVIVGNAAIYAARETLWALRLNDGLILWKSAIPGGTANPVSSAEGVLYVTSIEGILAYDAATGRQMWSRSTDPIVTAPVVGERLVAGGESGEMISTGRNGGGLRSEQVALRVTAEPILAGDTIYAITTHAGQDGPVEKLRAFPSLGAKLTPFPLTGMLMAMVLVGLVRARKRSGT